MKVWLFLLIWVGGLFVGSAVGWSISNQGTTDSQLQVSALQNELTVCEQNYELVIDALNEQNITRGLPVDDQIANLLEFLTDNGTVKYDITLSYHIDDDGMQSGDITIGLEKGDKINID